MIQAILAIFTLSASLGKEPPALVLPFKSTEACLIEAAKQNTANAEELAKHGARFTCLVITYPTT
jgi:hypothetical protein